RPWSGSTEGLEIRDIASGPAEAVDESGQPRDRLQQPRPQWGWFASPPGGAWPTRTSHSRQRGTRVGLSLLDDLIRPPQERRRGGRAERLRGLEVEVVLPPARLGGR